MAKRNQQQKVIETKSLSSATSADTNIHAKTERLGTIYEAEEFMKSNEFILRGYRLNFNSFRKLIKSLFIVHNESINVWTHLLGALIMFILVFHTCLFLQYSTDLIQDFNFSSFKKDFTVLTEPLMKKLYELELPQSPQTYFNNLDFNFQGLDDKFKQFSDYLKFDINCITCIKDILNYFASIKQTIESTTAQITQDSIKQDFYNFLQHIKDKEKHWEETYLYSLKTLSINSQSNIQIWPIFMMLIGAVICLSCSATFHLFYSHSEKISCMLNRLDYSGISILIVGSCYPPYYYLFLCEIKYLYIYMTITSLLGCIVFYISVKEEFASAKYHKIRGIVFLLFGVAAGAPILHLNYGGFMSMYGEDGVMFNLRPWIVGGLYYIIGCVLYITKFPERLAPGKFCIIGNSHQIFHVFVLLGVYTHYIESVEMYKFRLNNECMSK